MSAPTVVFVAGGTGGHVFPALAVAEQLRARGYRLAWIGTERGIEHRLVPAANIDLHLVRVSGIRGSGLVRKLTAPFMLLSALMQCLGLLGKIRPVLIVGFGGFVAGPAGLAAWLRRLPLVVHEQNAVAGTTNRILSRLATRVLVAFPGALPNAETTGNPVRADLVKADSTDRLAGRPIRLLVLGGSQGALALNQQLPACIAAQGRPLEVVHQCGERWLEQTMQAYQEAGVQAEVKAFIEDMAAAYRRADLVICRAGAMTVSELACVGKPALFIPFPYAIDDHQTANARWLAEQGAAAILSEAELPARGSDLLSDLLETQQLELMTAKAQQIDYPNALERIADLCEEVIHGD